MRRPRVRERRIAVDPTLERGRAKLKLRVLSRGASPAGTAASMLALMPESGHSLLAPASAQDWGEHDLGNAEGTISRDSAALRVP